MKRSELIGLEHIRHNNNISDINVFFDFIESHGVSPDRPFTINGDIVYCAMIDYENFQLAYTYARKEYADERDLFYYVPQKHIPA